MLRRTHLVRTLAGAALLATGVLIGGSSPDPVLPLPEVDLAAVDADNIYLSVPSTSFPILGESTSAKHPNTSTALSVASGVITSATATTTGRSTPQSVVITKPVDTYTPQLAKRVSSGQHLPSVTIWFAQTGADGERDIARLVLTDVLVKQSSLRFGAGGQATEVVTLVVRKEQLVYWPQKQDGSLGGAVVYCWNWVTNAAC